MKKVITAAIIVMLSASAVNAFSFDDVSSYVSDSWENICSYVMSWFTSDESASDETLPSGIAGKWDKLNGNLNDALTLRDKQETLPDSSWFGEDKVSNARKINELLDRAILILSGSDANNARAEAVRLRKYITELRTKLDTLRNNRITAPDNTSFFLFWRTTKPKIDAKISETENEIRNTEQQMTAINTRLTDELRNIGLELTDTQTDILLNSVTGSDILQNTVIFDNVKSVVSKLEELSQKDTNTLEIVKRYTGMYLVLNDLLIHTQEELVRKIETEYRPRLKEVMTEAESLKRQALTKSNDKAYTQAQRKAFALNAKSNATTIEAAKLYGQLLDSQKVSITASIRRLQLNRDLAENTYKTVRSSSELRALIHSGLNTFDAIGRLTMPELKIFENGAMRAEFDEINRRLNK